MYSRVEEKQLGSIEALTRLYKASTIDLVRHLSARKLPDGRYLIPIEHVPWCSIFNLDREYSIVLDNKPLSIYIEIEPSRLPTPVEICIGFLVKSSDFEHYCLGVLVTGRRVLSKCRFRIFQIPYDLWDFPKIIAIPEVKAICREVMAHEGNIRVEIPVDCIKDLNYDILISRTTSQVIAVTDLVSIIGNVKIRLFKDTISYSL